MNSIVAIPLPQLLLSLLFIFIAQATSVMWHLGLGRDIAVGALRTVAQLFLMGYALTFIFSAGSLPLTIGIFIVMVVSAVFIVKGRVKERQVAYLAPTLLTMVASYFLTALFVSRVIVGVEPWWEPRAISSRRQAW